MNYAFAFLALSIFFWPFTATSQQVHPDYMDGRIWVKLKKTAVVASDISPEGPVKVDHRNLKPGQVPFLAGLEPVVQFNRIEQPYHHIKSTQGLNRIYRLTLTDPYAIDEVIRKLNELDAVEYAEKVALMKKTLTPNDPDFNASDQWALFQISAESAWNLGTGSSNIVVAIVDDAVEITHPDLSPVIWTNTGEIPGNSFDDDGNGYDDDVNGFDVAMGDNDPNPDGPAYDHGTHVAGISGAATNNSTGVASIGYGISIMAVKATNSPTVISDGYDGIIYAVNSGADVINMSWGGSGSSATAQSIIDFANSNGIVCVAAAGNDNVSTQFYPAAYNNVISVASSTYGDSKSGFSNYGSWIDITAPGSAIWSTVPGGTYDFKQGTSMASPMVAGLAGLLLSLNPGLNPADVENCIRSTADNIDGANPSYIGQLGDGRINALAAMNCVSATLNWAPVADFSASLTNIIEGQTVDFTDLSYYNPTAWNWTFTGGSPASFSGQNPPAITYPTAGTYQVELTVTNANGSDTKTEIGYITVNALTGCDTISNTLATDGIFINRWVGGDGFLTGHNAYGMTRFAEQYQGYGPTTIMGAEFYFVEGETTNPASEVLLMVWEDDGSGMPGTMVYSEPIDMQIIEDNVAGPGPGSFFITDVDFDTPVTVSTSTFHVGYSVENATHTNDSVAIGTYNVTTDGGRPNRYHVFFEPGNPLLYPGNTWQSIETVTGGSQYVLHLYPRITQTPPTAVLSSDSPVCEGEYMTFDGTGSPNAVNWDWAINGTASPFQSGSNPSVIMNSAGTHTVYMAAYNSCGFYHIDSLDVVVNATPNVGVTSTQDTICPAGSSNLTASGAGGYVWSPATGLSCTTCSNPVANPAATTTYTVTGTTGSCSSDSYVTIVVDDSAPSAAFISSTDTICPGESVSYNGAISTGASIYNWTFTGGDISSSTSPNPTVMYASGGTYNVDLTVENSCSQTDNISGTIIVDGSTPTANYTTSADTICPGESITFDGSTSLDVNTYSWTFTGGDISTSGSANPTVTYASAGTYSVDLTVDNSCLLTDNMTSSVVVLTAAECATGLMSSNELYGTTAFTSGEQIQVNFGAALTGPVKIELVSALGQLISTKTINNPGNGHVERISTRGLKKAIYLIRVSSETSQYTAKLIVG